MRLPLYKLKLVRSGWSSYPRFSREHPQLAAYFFHKLIGQAVVEHGAAIFLDPVGQMLGSTIISVGDLGRVQMVAREVFKSAILANAASVIVSHNHPSGPAKPSAQDIRTTKRLIQAGQIIGIHLLDHIIVTPSETDFTSMRESGELTLWWPETGERAKAKAPTEPESTSTNRADSSGP